MTVHKLRKELNMINHLENFCSLLNAFWVASAIHFHHILALPNLAH
uniref:Uncharacterized protein n=1 Tax=Rhizophora mucronata TaxID=61149 RepID=A0A2P2P4E7_RHIMU